MAVDQKPFAPMFSGLAALRRALLSVVRARSSGCLCVIRRAWRHSVVSAVLCAACGAPAWATVNVEGVPFDEAAHLAGRNLLLNGTGLRAVFVIKGYVAGLYLPERAKNAAVVLGMKGPKRLQIHPLRDVGADKFIHALNDGIHRNQTEVQVQKLSDRLVQLEDAMRQIGSTRRGDTINFDYAPETGTIVTVNGVTRGRPIFGEDFYQAVLSIFIGNNPVDRDLKNGLLGT